MIPCPASSSPKVILLAKSFFEASQSANQLVERAPSMGSNLFPTSPAVSHPLLRQYLWRRSGKKLGMRH
jgi:hypothetical protein